MDQNKFEKKCLNFTNSYCDSENAVRFVVEVFVSDIYPLIARFGKKLQVDKKDQHHYYGKAQQMYLLCTDQIKKCFLTFVEIIKNEYNMKVCLQDSRQFTLERLLWCYSKLLSLNSRLDSLDPQKSYDNSANDLMLEDTMYFVNWVDQTFDILDQLSSFVYKIDNNSNEWKTDLIESVCELHSSIDELLLSAMTLCKYCLPSDHFVVKARSQVVLRETKVLLSELVLGNPDSDFQVTLENLNLPIKPSNVNVFIDVLKDVLYALETNTNTALLSLLVHCFMQSISPVDLLRNHLKLSKKGCDCPSSDDDDVIEKCVFVKEFDLYNERIMQIGSFAMSCSSDRKRILGLRSGLASLEALDPHLVPALTLSPSGNHATLLADIWKQEISQIRDNIFLIVDPAAFTDKVKQMMHQTLLEIMKENLYNNKKSCEVINIGFLVYDFFNVYNKFEPDALTHSEQLQPLLKDLYKAQTECKIVSNNLCSLEDYKYDIKKSTNVNVTLDKFIKRLKLLYTIIKRIYLLFNPSDNDEEFYKEDLLNDKTYTLDLENKNTDTYVQSPKVVNLTRTIFARTNNIRSARKFPLSVLTKHLKPKELSFSIKLDELCNLSEVQKRESSILYHSPIRVKSLRKAVLNRRLKPEKFVLNDNKSKADLTDGSFMNDNTSLQITDILNQLNDITNNLATNDKATAAIDLKHKTNESFNTNANDTFVRSKQTWEFSANSIKDYSNTDVSQPSDINTLERISDLDLVESRLSDLKFGHVETNL